MKVTDQGVPVDALISVVKDSIRQAGVSRTAQARDLQVASVRLILDVVASKTAGGGVDFCVPFIGMRLSVGAKVTKKDTHTIDIALVPPEDQDIRQVRGEVEDALVNAIATIRNVMTKAAEGDDPWLLSAGTIDISFAIAQTGTISVGVDGELANELTHTLRLELAPPPVLSTGRMRFARSHRCDKLVTRSRPVPSLARSSVLTSTCSSWCTRITPTSAGPSLRNSIPYTSKGSHGTSGAAVR